MPVNHWQFVQEMMTARNTDDAILWSHMPKQNHPKFLIIIDAMNEGHKIISSAIVWKHCGQRYSIIVYS